MVMVKKSEMSRFGLIVWNTVKWHNWLASRHIKLNRFPYDTGWWYIVFYVTNNGDKSFLHVT